MDQSIIVEEKCIKYNLLLTVGFIVLLSILYRFSIIDVVRLWSTVGTYNHGFLVAPIVIWLLWRNRDCINCINIGPSYTGVFVSSILVIFWIVSYKNEFEFGHHLAFFTLIISIVWSVWGWEYIRYNMFPFFFLLFSVPFGDILIPLLQNMTATVVVFFLKITGIPVYREGLFFYIPTGAFEIARACSGIRYLIASITIGVLYAYLRYTKTWKRVLVVFLSLLIPLVANGIRAYIIVLIAHLSGFKYATGVDHLIYGWLFFGIVIFIFLYIGSRFEDDEAELAESIYENRSVDCVWSKKTAYVSLLLVMVLFSGQAALNYYS